MTKLLKYQQQFKRMKRWYGRIKKIDQRIPDEFNLRTNFRNYLDEVYAFFQNCYHLKDWIKNDDTVTQLAKDKVEDFIDKNVCMSICADLCNGSKHLKLIKPSRSKKDPKLQGLKVSMKRGEPKPIIKVKISIKTKTGTIDALELVSECVQKWEEFIKKNIS